MGKRKGKPRKPPAGVPELASSRARQPNGDYRRKNDKPTDPRKAALAARCVQMGVEPTKYARQAAAAQHLEHPLGRVMAFRCSAQEISRLWGTWRALQAAKRAYENRILSRSSDPKGMALELLPEPLEADDNHTVDIRSRDERDEAARKAWDIWRERLAKLSPRDRHLLMEQGPTLYSAQWRQPTAAGLATLEALKALHAVVTRKE